MTPEEIASLKRCSAAYSVGYEDALRDCFMVGKRVKVNSPSSQFDGETGTIERVYYAIRMDSLAKKKEENPNFKGSTVYSIVSSNVEVLPNE